MRFLAGWIAIEEERRRRLRQIGGSERTARRRLRR
jgi:hypothetical protein